MDIQIKQKKSKSKKYIILVFIAFIVIFLFVYLKQFFSGATAWVERDEIRTATVQSGNFAINVRGSGSFKSDDVYLISAKVPGTVERILVKAGTPVEKGQELFKLSNPEIAEQMIQAEAKLKQMLAKHKAELAQLDASLLDIKSIIVDAKFDLQYNKIKYDAQTHLRKIGNSTVSELDYQQTEFSVKRSKETLEIQHQRLNKHRERLEAQQQANIQEITNLESELSRFKYKLQQLTVVSPVSGRVEQTSIELGQSLSVNNKLAQIADINKLYAEVKVEELQSGHIAVGQRVTLDTRQNKIQGKVMRIDPRVVSGQVIVDVSIEQALPSEARPDLSLEGIIHIVEKDHTVFVKKPANARENETGMVLKLNKDMRLASLTKVQFGQLSVNQIEIINGIAAGDRIIISDVSAFSNNKEVLIND